MNTSRVAALIAELPQSCWEVIIDKNWRVYNCLIFAVCDFGRKSLTARAQAFWREQFTDVVYDGLMTSYFLADRLHRDGDLPARTVGDCYKLWCRFGQRHRKGDKPALIDNGDSYWYAHGKLHRKNGKPAVICASGKLEWFRHGYPSRDYDLPHVVWRDGTQKWCDLHGSVHRIGKPAIIYPNGALEWFEHGVLVKSQPVPVIPIVDISQIIAMLPPSTWCVVIGDDWRLYRLLALTIPQFGRATLATQAYWRKHFTRVVTNKGAQFWYLADRLHRDDDLPAAVWGGDKNSSEWWKYGKQHRDDDKPAVDGRHQTWRKNGDYYRRDGLPNWVTKDSQYWVTARGVVNRSISHGKQCWHDYDGMLHRRDGPAVINPDGSEEWWTHGVRQPDR